MKRVSRPFGGIARGLAVAAGLAILRPSTAAACAVCYGMAEGNMIDGARLAIVFMLALTYLLLGGGIGMVWIRRRRLAAGPPRQIDGPDTGKDARE